MAQPDHPTRITVEQLLRIKKSEVPTAEFWDSFEHDFQRRRLQMLLNDNPAPRVAWAGLLKLAAVAVPVLAVSALFLSQQSAMHSSETGAAPPSLVVQLPADSSVGVDFRSDPVTVAESPGAPFFVLDAIHVLERSASFQRVLPSPALKMPVNPGAYYVRDPLASGDYRVTTADARLGRNF